MRLLLKSIIVFLLLLTPCVCFAQKVLNVDRQFTARSLGRTLEVAEDPDGNVGIEYASKETGPLHFKSQETDEPHAGFTKSTYWTRIAFKNTDSERVTTILELEYPLLDQVDLYTSVDGEQWQLKKSGDSLPFNARDLDYRNLCFILDLQPGQTLQIYLNVKTSSSMQLAMNLFNWYSFFENEQIDQLGYGILFGLMIVLVIYNLFLFFPTKDKSYLYYCLYIAVGLVFLAALSGHGYQFLWPHFPWCQQRLIPLAIASWSATSSIFTRSFLVTRQNAPRIDRILVIIIYSHLLLGLLSLIAPVQIVTRIGTVTCIFVSLTTFIAGFWVWLRGFRPARFFVLAWVFFCVGVILYALKSLALVPSTFITVHGMEIGTIIETILISMALGDMIHLLRIEREKNQAREKAEVKIKEDKMHKIQALTKDLANVSTLMTNVLTDVANSSGEVASALTRTDGSARQIEQGAMKVEAGVNRIAKETQLNDEQWLVGWEAIKKTSSAMQEIKTDSEKIAAMTRAAFTDLKQMDVIITLANSVSEQSKVLSVNASIEASNAGEWGRGFGVIAQEMNTLAQESSSATAKVTKMLVDVRAQLEKIVEVSSKGTARTQEGAQKIESTEAVITVLTDVVQKNSKQAIEIADSIHTQTSGLKNIMNELEMINQTAKENLASVEKLKHAKADVGTTVDDLQKMMKDW